ncbi:MAG: universal stress protein [Thermoguttaceae bacterium]
MTSASAPRRSRSFRGRSRSQRGKRGRRLQSLRSSLTAVNDPGPCLPPSLIEQAREVRRAVAQAYLDRVAERLRAKGLRIQTHVVVGESPAVAVLDMARDKDIDLIAIAPHGRRALKLLFLGSVADKIVRGTFTPVLVYRPMTNG